MKRLGYGNVTVTIPHFRTVQLCEIYSIQQAIYCFLLDQPPTIKVLLHHSNNNTHLEAYLIIELSRVGCCSNKLILYTKKTNHFKLSQYVLSVIGSSELRVI